MKKLNLPLKILFSLIILFLIGSTIYLFSTKETLPKLTVDQILEDHLKTRFDEEPKIPEIIIHCRDRIFTSNVQCEKFPLPYLSFIPLNNDEVSINSPLSNTIVYTDFHIKKAPKDKAAHKIAWFIESPKPHAKGFKFLRKKHNEEIFDKIYTCYRPLLEKGDPYIFTPVEGTSANPDINLDEVIQNKNQGVSIIASKKNWAPGHKLRHKTVDRFKDKIDTIVGRGYKPIDTTSEGLLGVRYSIVIENRKQDFYFSEKIIDCILCGTVPIYWGCPSIGKFFNDTGIIQFDNLDELEVILSNLSIEDYNKRLDAIKENFNTAHCYLHKDKYFRRELQKALPELMLSKNNN